jgi:hypothetical protein
MILPFEMGPKRGPRAEYGFFRTCSKRLDHYISVMHRRRAKTETRGAAGPLAGSARAF